MDIKFIKLTKLPVSVRTFFWGGWGLCSLYLYFDNIGMNLSKKNFGLMYYLTYDVLYNFFFSFRDCLLFSESLYILIAGYILFFKHFLGEIDTQIFVLVYKTLHPCQV